LTSIDARMAGLPAERQALLAKLLSERRAAGRTEISRREGPQPLADAQRQFYLLWQQEPDSGVYNVPIALRLRGELDPGAARTALREIVRRHEILRTRYTTVDGEPDTVLGDHEGVELERHDLSALPGTEREAAAVSLVAELASRPFDLEADLPIRASLVALDDRDHVLLIDVHHIAIDAASSQILFREFTAVYTAVSTGHAAGESAAALPELPIRYADYAGWQQARAESGALRSGLDFWNTYLDGADTSLDLPTDRPRPARLTLTGDRRWRHLSPELTEQIRAFSAEQGVTPFMTALTALGLVLRRQTGKQDFLVGTSASNRPTPRTEQLIGCFANTTVLRVRAPDGITVREALHQTREDVTAAFDHQDVPFEKVVALRRPDRTLAQNPLFQVMFVCPQLPEGGGLPGVTAERFEMHNGTARFDIEIALLDNPDGIDLFCEYATELFTPERVDGLLGHLENALRAMLADPDAPLGALSVLDEAEYRRAALEWNDTAAPYPDRSSVAGLFADRVAAHPDAPAVCAGERTLDYAELDRRANRLARLLARRGARPGTVVGVAVERTADLPLCVLAVLKSGAAYLPLDAAHPAGRLALMLGDSDAMAVLTARAVADRVPVTDAEVLVLEDLEQQLAEVSGEPFACPAAPDDLCYTIFTSGSTGRPKAVPLDQRGRINNFTDFNRRYTIGPGDAVLSVSSLGFDMTAYDVVGTLLAGGTLVLPDPARERDPGHWIDLIAQHGVTVWHSVPTLLGLLVDAAADLGVKRLPTLRVVLLGGDWIPVALPDRLRALASGARVVSLGGATEASMDSTLFEIGEVDPGWRSIPYGRPMANQLAYVLDPEGHLVPPGVPGELLLGGQGLAWGYLGAAGQTADRFLPDPFSQAPGARMYRTGDLARYRHDGVLELLGRMDFQVKIAGNRVELGEVEAALRALAGIAEAVAAAPATDGPRSLVGYVVPDRAGSADTDTDTEALREQLRTRLPEYMVPSALVVLEAIPLTPNGKVDRGRLPLPDAAGARGKRPHGGAPGTPTEVVLAGIWQNLLSQDEVSADDGFFALGGDSVTCIRLVTRARAAGLELTPRMVFQHQTIGELAAAVDRGSAGNTEGAGAAGEPGDGPEAEEEPDGLAPIQRHMLAVTRRRPQPGLYVMQSAYPLPGDLDEKAFREAWQWLFDRHPILRTSYRDADSEQPRPVLADHVDAPVDFRDLRGRTPAEQEQLVLAELEDLRLQGFALDSAPLLRLKCYRLTDDEGLMVQLHHYSLLDAWSCARLYTELLTAYPAFAAGEQPDLPAPPPSGLHAVRLSGRERRAAVDFWDGYLRDCPGPWAGEPDGGPGRPVSFTAEAGPGLMSELELLGRENGITISTLVQLAWAAVLSADTGSDDVVFGVTVSGRLTAKDTETAIGPFINTMPVRFAIRDGERVTAAALRLQLERSAAEEHSRLELGAMSGSRDLTSVLVFSNFLVDDALQAAARESAGAAHPLLAQQLGVSHLEFPVRLEISRAGQGLLTFTFAADRTLPDGASELGPRLVAVLQELTARPEGPVNRLVRRARGES
jgi:amino acid adenylation domain-containing protein